MASASTCKFPLSLLFVLILAWGSQSCHGLPVFGFDIHHRFSDPVKGILPVDELPEKGSLDYYAALAHRDRIIRGRGLSSSGDQILTFADGNMTFRISSLGFLHYASVSLGTPNLTFLVALDTGSDLFWVPCNCTSCVKALVTDTGDKVDLNIYDPSASSTSKKVPCNSSICEYQKACSGLSSDCPYQVSYLSGGTSTTGILVEDVLHLTTDNNHPEFVDAHITFGCGQVETGSFLESAAPNGLFGLGIDKLSVPSILSATNLTANSFSMCFGSDGIGRINFGDKGSVDQDETPFNLLHSQPTYNISVTQITVGTNVTDINFSAIFDSGTSFTSLDDPAYTLLSESFNAQAQDKRLPSDPSISFEYCYELSSSNATDTILVPIVNLTMKGGSQFPVSDPIVIVTGTNYYSYCLGVIKSSDTIIGQNFMTGLRIVFDREKQVLGWKKSNCYDIEDSNTQPIRNSTTVPPAIAVEPGNYSPEATKGTGNSILLIGWSPHLNLFGCILLMPLFLF